MVPLLADPASDEFNGSTNTPTDTPTTWHNAKAEFKTWAYLAFPAAFTSMFNCSLTFTDAAVLGHLSFDTNYPNATSTDFLSAISLGYSWMYALNIFIFAGFASAISVLSSQAFGAKNYFKAHQIYLAGVVCSFFINLPIGIGFWYCADVVKFILPTTTTPLRYNLIQDFSRVMLVTLPGQTLAQCTCNFLNAANVVRAPLYVSFFSAAINLMFNIALVHGIPALGMPGHGFRGSPIATAATNCIAGLLLFGYLLFGKGSHAHVQSSLFFRRTLCCCLGGKHSRQKLQSHHQHTHRTASHCCDAKLYASYIKQAIPLALGGAFEEWQIQVVGFFAGALGPISTASNNGMQQIFVTLSSLNYGIMTATTVRVGYYLGEGSPQKSKSVTIIAFLASLLCGTVIGLCFIVFRSFMGTLFSIDPHVIQLSSTLCWIVGPTYVLLSMFFVSVATLQGQNRSGILAICFLIGAWIVSVPAAWYFAFSLKMGLPGIWYGLVFGYGMIMLLTSVAVYKSNWVDIAEQAVLANRQESHGHGSEKNDSLDPSCQHLSTPLL